jgi:hypothetical protein
MHRSTGQRAVVGEHKVLTVEAAAIRKVVAGVRGDAAESPRVLAHQLRVRINGQLRCPCRAGVGDLEAEQHAATPVRDEVGALDG